MPSLTQRQPAAAELDSGLVVQTVSSDPVTWAERLTPAAAGEPFPESGRSLGLVDLQVNGFAGVDFNDEGLTPEALDHALEVMLSTGVTTCLPTIITAERVTLMARFRALDAAVAQSRLGPWMVPGYHLEGPFLNPGEGFAGCHPAAAMIPAAADLVTELESALTHPILLITVAPEIEGALAFIRWASARGKLVAIGHSSPDEAVLAAAVDAGLSLATHLGNGLPQTLPKLANPLFWQLAEDRLTATMIADGIHIPPAALKAMIRAKGPDRSILVTDAVSAAAARPGLHPFAGMSVELSADGTVRQPGSRYLAGSSLCLDAALRNVVRFGIAPPRDALRMACANPRLALAEPLRRHGLYLPASLVTWSSDLGVESAAAGPFWRRN
jgi:N-acetylglucosamine-6-phosphate deacetylase